MLESSRVETQLEYFAVCKTGHRGFPIEHLSRRLVVNDARCLCRVSSIVEQIIGTALVEFLFVFWNTFCCVETWPYYRVRGAWFHSASGEWSDMDLSPLKNADAFDLSWFVIWCVWFVMWNAVMVFGQHFMGGTDDCCRSRDGVRIHRDGIAVAKLLGQVEPARVIFWRDSCWEVAGISFLIQRRSSLRSKTDAQKLLGFLL